MRYFNPAFVTRPPLFVAFNAQDKSAVLTLSSNLLTATETGSGDGAVRATLARLAGKFYCELNMVTCGGGDTGAGFAAGDVALASIASSVTHAFCQFRSGNVYNNTALQFANGNMSGGGILRAAYDASNHKAWLAFGAGNWNGNPANDPGTGVGGVDVSAYDSAGLFPCFACGLTGEVCTVNFGATTFSFAPPSGFLAWNAS